jgi:nucleotide-binding universal stress UspA family protein
MASFRRIMHPTDFSKASGRAFDMAVDLAKQNKAELLLVHVLTPVIPYAAGDAYADPSLYVEIEKKAREEARASIGALEKKAKKSKVKVKTLLLEGTPYDRVVRAAKGRRAELIVMGTHGRTGLTKLLMGSVAGRVISLAHCPVMTVRGK